MKTRLQVDIFNSDAFLTITDFHPNIYIMLKNIVEEELRAMWVKTRGLTSPRAVYSIIIMHIVMMCGPVIEFGGRGEADY